MPAKKWLDNQVTLAPLKNQTITVIGIASMQKSKLPNMQE